MRRAWISGYLPLITALMAAAAPGQVASASPPSQTFALPSTGTTISLPASTAGLPVKLSSRQAAQLAAMLADAPLHAIGLQRGPAGQTDAQTAGDTQLIVSTLAYARAVHAGQLDTADFIRAWGLRPAAYDPAPSFYDALSHDTLARWIASLPPPYAGYDGLRRGLARYRAIQSAGGWPQLAPGPDLVLGGKGERVAALRRRLRIEDPDAPSSGDTFDLPLLDAVRRAQRRYGLPPTGNVAAQTRAALNVPVSARIRQITSNMERWRWLPQDLPRDRIQVNIAAAVLTMFQGDTPVLSMRAITGRPEDQTPMLQSNIHSIVLNPPWNVPTSIATRELLPKEHASPGYLKRNGFRLIRLADGGTRLQQAAGTQSALGRYKFDFNNPYSVYLHDTPAHATFARYSRMASHGCVRLERPAELAALLLKNDPRWSTDAIQAAVSKTDTLRVRLSGTVAVYLLYWTAFTSANGQVNFRDDPYGWDAALWQKIDQGSGAQQVAAR
jgi:L,D-transpeptidase YcbB